MTTRWILPPWSARTTTSTSSTRSLGDLARELDDLDAQLEVWAREIPNLEPVTEGIVERIQSLGKAFDRSLDETLAEFGIDRHTFHVLGNDAGSIPAASIRLTEAHRTSAPAAEMCRCETRALPGCPSPPATGACVEASLPGSRRSGVGPGDRESRRRR